MDEAKPKVDEAVETCEGAQEIELANNELDQASGGITHQPLELLVDDIEMIDVLKDATSAGIYG